MKLRNLGRHGRRFRKRNIFWRWGRLLLSRFERSNNRRRRNVGQINWRRFALHRCHDRTAKNQDRAPERRPKELAGRRLIENRFSHLSLPGARNSCLFESLALNFEGNFIVPDRSQNIEDPDDVPMNCIGISTNEYLGLRIFIMNPF